MADDLFPVYDFETVEQMRSIADTLRQRIVEVIIPAPMTVTQIGEALGVPAQKVHYHVRELERVGLVRLVETREKGGILEKYYRPVARNFRVPASLLHSVSPDETLRVINEFFEEIARGFVVAAAETSRRGAEEPPSLALSRSFLWMTDEEIQGLYDTLSAALAPYTQRREVEGVREISFVQVLYPVLPEPDSAPLERDRVWEAGVFSYDRRDLERVIASGKQLDMTLIGMGNFADDVTPDLVERAIGHIRVVGKVNASPQVRAVLEHKGLKPEGRQ